MTNSKILFKEIVNRIRLPESKEEIESIAYRLMEAKLNLNRSDILLSKEAEYNENEIRIFIDRINQHEPIQYILNEEYFFGRKFYVDSSVLIPRPETEEMVRHILSDSRKSNPRIVDIGTGSGCIAITLALELKNAEVKATDVSNPALAVAKKNSDMLKSPVEFLKHDILNEELPEGKLDWIVSNPPYISASERQSINKNVSAHEPHLALFADPDPLIFYKAIAFQAKSKLNNGGKVIVEINEKSGNETAAIFTGQNLSSVKILKDINGKDRFVIATRS
jgi:release factor glutamine methyltransferase